MSELKQRNKTKELSIEKPPGSVQNKDADKKNSVIKPVSSIWNRSIPLRVLSRIVVITSLLIVVYFSSKDEKVKPFAKQSELLPGKGQIVECSEKYLREIESYQGCYPRACKRFVSDKVISQKEADELLAIAKRGFNLASSSGGVSVLDVYNGVLSKDQVFVNFYTLKEGKNLYNEADFNILRVTTEKIKYAVAHHFELDPTKIYLTKPMFFSEMTSRDPVTLHDEYWHPHVDKDSYETFHYTTLLYLSDYGINFEGGRFVYIDEKQNRTVEPRKARVSMFTSGGENSHYVEKVTKGVRYAITIPFTCDKKSEMVRNK